jgi:hypothetical protein
LYNYSQQFVTGQELLRQNPNRFEKTPDTTIYLIVVFFYVFKMMNNEQDAPGSDTTMLNSNSQAGNITNNQQPK